MPREEREMKKGKSICVMSILALAAFYSMLILSDYASPKGTLKENQQRQRQLRQEARPVVSSVNPNDLKLVKGGSSQVVTVKGNNLNRAASVQILYRGNVTQEVTANFLQPRSSAEQKVEFRASSNAIIGSDYQVRLIVGNQSLDLPSKVLRLEIVAPEARFAVRAEKQLPATKSVQTVVPYVPGPRKPGPMLWSSVSQRGSDPERPTNPPIITRAQMGKQVQFRNDLIQYPSRAKLDFIPFRMVDPAKGTPIDLNSVIRLPDGVSLTALDYYNELNFFEKSLNESGYSLDPARDPRNEVNLGGIPAQLGRTNARIRWDDSVDRIAKTTRENINIRVNKAKALMTSAATSAVAAKKMTVATKELPVVAKLKDTQVQQPVSASVTPYHRPLNPEVFSAGNDVFGAGTNASADLFADTDKMTITNEVNVTGSIAGNEFRIFTVKGVTASPISGGASSATCIAYVLGQAHTVYDQQKPVPAGPLTQMSGGVPYFDFDENYSLSANYEYSWTIMVTCCIPIVITVGASSGVGLNFAGGCGPAAMQNSINPYAFTDIYASAAVDYYLASAGVETNTVLINAQTGIVCALTRAFENVPESTGSLRSQAVTKAGSSAPPASHSIWADYWIRRNYGALSGSLGVFLKFRYPCLKDLVPDICTKKYSLTLFDWPGIFFSDDLVKPTYEPQTLCVYADGKIPGYNL